MDYNIVILILINIITLTYICIFFNIMFLVFYLLCKICKI